MPQVAKLDAACVWDPDMDKIAAQVMQTLPFDQRERAFAIYKRIGPEGLVEYCNSIPITGKNDSFEFETEKGSKLAAIAHTHPGHEHSNATFSMNDVAMADTLKRPSYIRTDSGDVRRYDPGVSPTRANGDGKRLAERGKVSDGTLLPQKTRREEIEMAYNEAARGAPQK